MGDLALVFSHHMQQNKNGETSRKGLHVDQEEDEKASALACIISLNNSSSQQYSAMCNNINQCHNNIFENSLLFPKIEANNSTISFSKYDNENNINIIGAQFGIRRTREQADEHLLAERKRRQKIAKLFVSLASLLPGLNKMDKASILEGATNLIRQLGERLEANNEKEADCHSSIDMMKSSTLPQVEVRSSEEELLITILLYCKNKQKGIIDEVLSVIQRLHLTIKTTNFMPFGRATMHIKVIAQKNAEFCETTDFLVNKLRSTLMEL